MCIWIPSGASEAHLVRAIDLHLMCWCDVAECFCLLESSAVNQSDGSHAAHYTPWNKTVWPLHGFIWFSGVKTHTFVTVSFPVSLSHDSQHCSALSGDQLQVLSPVTRRRKSEHEQKILLDSSQTTFQFSECWDIDTFGQTRLERSDFFSASLSGKLEICSQHMKRCKLWLYPVLGCFDMELQPVRKWFKNPGGFWITSQSLTSFYMPSKLIFFFSKCHWSVTLASLNIPSSNVKDKTV